MKKNWKTIALAAAVVIGVGSYLLQLPKPGPVVTLEWDYGNAQDIVFNVYSSTDLVHWAGVAVVPGSDRSVTLPRDKSHEFFRVTASNTVTQMESP